jgi:uncharacterized protein
MKFFTTRQSIMKKYLVMAAMVICLPFSSALAQQQDEPPEFPYPQVIQKAVLDFFVPTYEQFVGKAIDMHAAMDQLCTQPGQMQLDIARASFKKLVVAWSRAETIQFGPVGNMARRERILFWPDKKGIGARQFRKIIRSSDQGALDPETLAGKSVAVQGMTALEKILFEKSASNLVASKPGAAYRCAFGKSVAANIINQSKRVLEEWDKHPSYADQMMHPGPHNPHFHDSNNSAATLISTFSHALEVIQDQKLRPTLGTGLDLAKPKKSQWRLSSLGLTALEANFQALEDLYTLSGLGAVLPKDEQWIDKTIRSDFATARALFKRFDMPLFNSVTDPSARVWLSQLVDVAGNLQLVLGTEIARAHGVVLGFEWVDGD